ncbi:MAG: sugar transferase [Candidatus Eremiobacteraeota bacterium]|nr:sugar transferase [Candidatus Eremiobacteraeota bacterium]
MIERETATLTHRFDHAGNRMRRVFDSVVAVAMLTIASPIVALACVAILIEDGGPVLFKQRRAGRFERLFVIYKLRTMRRESCGDGPAPADSSDPRVTKVGRVLRRTSIDELPQLINVLRGEMSIVGPRPEMPLMLERYENWQHLRHLVTPGLTCIWQISARSNIPLHRPEATALDLDYIRRASPRLDSVLLARTILSVVFPKGAY